MISTPFVNIIHFLYIVLIMAIAVNFYIRVLTLKPNLKHRKAACYTICLLFMFITALPVEQYTTLASIQFMIALAFPVLCPLFFNGSFLTRISTYLLIYVLEFFTEIFVSNFYTIANLFLPEKHMPRVMATNGEVFPTLLSHFLLTATFALLCQFISLTIEKYFQYIHLGTLIYLSAPFLIIFLHHNIMIELPVEYLPVTSILLWSVFFIALFFLLKGIKSFETQEIQYLKKENKKQQLLNNSKHYELLYQETLEQRRWAHDFLNHLETIQYMIRQGEYDEAKTYIQDAIAHTETIFHKAD